MMDVANRIAFPATPEEMYWLLRLEEEAKRDGGLTTNGLTGYIVLYWTQQRLAHREGGDNNGTVESGAIQPDRVAEGSRSIDDSGVPVQ
jgi:hypothetical protein